MQKSTTNQIKKEYHSKFNEKIFIVRLKRAYKKASLRELQLVLMIASQEIERRTRKKWHYLF